MPKILFLFLFQLIILLFEVNPVLPQTAPDIPHIDNLTIVKPQPQESDPAVIWYDDFNGPEKKYEESTGDLSESESFGGPGKSITGYYAKGSQGTGNRKVFFGRNPAGSQVKTNQNFTDVYWRFYVKHPYNWTGGGPAKLSRATSLTSSQWTQAMISHVWSSAESLTLDPASGVIGDKVATTKYNDFENLHWLGNKPASATKLFSPEETGRWVCIEARACLNTPGQKDGVNQLWIDGRLECERRNLDWRGNYTEYGINAVFLETYWNDGSPVTQTRWIDNFVISPKPIGPVVCPRNPVLTKTTYHGPGKQQAWECETAVMETNEIVWKSHAVSDPQQVRIDADTGVFVGSLSGQTALQAGKEYVLRCRQQSDSNTWSLWSTWHQPFFTETGQTGVGAWGKEKG